MEHTREIRYAGWQMKMSQSNGVKAFFAKREIVCIMSSVRVCEHNVSTKISGGVYIANGVIGGGYLTMWSGWK